MSAKKYLNFKVLLAEQKYTNEANKIKVELQKINRERALRQSIKADVQGLSKRSCLLNEREQKLLAKLDIITQQYLRTVDKNTPKGYNLDTYSKLTDFIIDEALL